VAPAVLAGGPIKSQLTDNRCVDINGNSKASGAAVISWYCHNGDNQQWLLLSTGEIRSRLDLSKCLDVSGGTAYNGTRVQSYDCNGTGAQKWDYNPRTGELKSRAGSNMCLAIPDGNTTAGTHLITWQCVGLQDQKWTIAMLPWSQVKSALSSNLCLDVSGNQPNGNAIMWLCHNGANQGWMLNKEGELRSSVANNRCLTIAGFFPFAGANVISWECQGGMLQKWSLTEKGELRSQADPNLCLDVHNAETYPGTNVKIWLCNGNKAQQWASSSFMEMELMKFDGYVALSLRSGSQASIITAPEAILMLMKQNGASDQDLAFLINNFNPIQKNELIRRFGSTVLSDMNLAMPVAGIAVISGMVSLSGPEAEAPHCAGTANASDGLGVNCEGGIKLLGGEAGPASGEINTISGSAINHFNPNGSFEINNGFDLISGEGLLGDENGSYAGVGGGVGLGLEGAAKWGEDDQYGFTVGIKAVTIKLYVKGDDVKRAFNSMLEGLVSFGLTVAEAMVELGAALETVAEFFEKDVVNFFNDAGSELESVGNAVASTATSVWDEIIGWF